MGLVLIASRTNEFGSPKSDSMTPTKQQQQQTIELFMLQLFNQIIKLLLGSKSRKALLILMIN